MHLVNIAIILGIGNFVAWMAALYVKNAMYGLIGHVIISTLGAFTGGQLSLSVFPQYGVVGMISAGFLGSGLYLYLVRFKTWSWQRKDIPEPEPVKAEKAKPEPVKIKITTPKPKPVPKTLIEEIYEDYTKILEEYNK